MDTNSFIMPTGTEDVLKIENAIKEASNSFLRADAERELLKDIKYNMKELFGMPPKLFTRLAKTYHAQNFFEQVSQDEEYEALYESIFSSNETT